MIKKNDTNWFKISTIVLGVLIVLLAGYMIFDKMANHYQQQAVRAYNQGYEQAKIDVISGIYQTTENCVTARLTIQNYTKEVVDVACLQQAQAAQQQQ